MKIICDKSLAKKTRLWYSQNLNLRIQDLGWRLDLKKLRIYLKDKFRVSKAIIFIGYLKNNEELYKMLRNFGYELVFKPTVKDKFGKVKGNVDAEVVLHSANIEYNNYDKGVFVSGDGDFFCLYEFLLKKNKLGRILIPNRNSESSLLIKFQDYKIFLFRDREKLEFKNKKREA